MKFKVDIVFVIALCLVLSLGIYMNRLRRHCHQLEQENLYYKGNNNYLNQYGIALEQSLWEMGKRFSLKDYKLRILGDSEQNTYALPANKLIINCCNMSDDSIKIGNVLEIIRLCRAVPQLQIITDSSWYVPVGLMLDGKKNCQIWLALDAKQWLDIPTVFLIDREGVSYGNFTVNSYTNRLFTRYFHFIQNQYDFE